MAAKTAASGFSFLKEAPLLLTRIPKLLAPFMLFAIIGILIPTVRHVYLNRITAEMSHHLTEMEEHKDPSSVEYARLLKETQHDARGILVISIAIALVTLALTFAKQIFARFCGTTSSSSGDRYSLAELFREVTKWRNLKSSLFTIVAVHTVLQLASMALLGGNFSTVMRESALLSVRGSVFLLAFLAFLYLAVLALTSIAVRRKEFSVLVTPLLPALLILVCAVVFLYLYTEQVMGLGMSLLSLYDLLQGVHDLLYLSAANMYCYQVEAMKESKEMVAACDEEKED